MIERFGPNFSILTTPSNWFLVAFSMAVLLFLSYSLLKAPIDE